MYRILKKNMLTVFASLLIPKLTLDVKSLEYVQMFV